METLNCFDKDKFSQVFNAIESNGDIVSVDDKLIIQRSTKAKELMFENYALVLLDGETDSTIVVIDQKKSLPTFTASIKNEEVKLSAYESRIDTESDILNRQESWCHIVNNIVLSKE